MSPLRTLANINLNLEAAKLIRDEGSGPRVEFGDNDGLCGLPVETTRT